MAGNEDKIRKDIADNLKDIVGDKASADIASKVEVPKNGGEIHVTAKVPVNTEQQQQSAPGASQSANDDYDNLSPDEIESLIQSGDVDQYGNLNQQLGYGDNLALTQQLGYGDVDDDLGQDFNPDDYLDDQGGAMPAEENSTANGGTTESTTATHNESNGTSETSQHASNASASKNANTSETPHVALHPSSSSRNTASKDNPSDTAASNVNNNAGNEESANNSHDFIDLAVDLGELTKIQDSLENDINYADLIDDYGGKIPRVEESSDYKKFSPVLQNFIDTENIHYAEIKDDGIHNEHDTQNSLRAGIESAPSFRTDKYIGNAAKNIADDEIQGIDYRPLDRLSISEGLPLGHVANLKEDKLLSPEQRKDLAKRQLAFRRMDNGLNLDGSLTDKQLHRKNIEDLSRKIYYERLAAQSAADTQKGRAQKNIPHASNAGTNASNAPQANPMVNADAGAANHGVGDNASMPTNGSSAQGADQSPEQQLADQLFNNQQSDFDAQKAAARDKLANDHNGSKFNSAIDNASNAVNDKMTGIANGINNRMQANNGGIFKDNGNLLNKVGNGLWKHGGSNLTAKGLNAVNNGLQGALRGIQNMGQKIAKNVQRLISIVTNPLLWYSLVAVVIIIALFTMALTYGNGGITCPNQGTGSGNSGDQIASWAEKIAADDSHGYSQKNRNGDPDYDCSSLVYYAVTKGAGIQLSINYPFSTSNEKDILQAAGFTGNAWDGKDTSVLQRGDIVWEDGHTEIYSGNGKFTGAHMNEKNGTGRPPDPESTPGDQTGHEISTENVIPEGMTYYLRSPGKSTSDSGTVSAGAEADFTGENAKRIFDYLTNDMGFSGAGAAGALAVAMRESHFDPKAQNTGGGVAGIFQWSGFSNTVNQSRINQEGSIKPGDESTLTLENEIKLLGFELNTKTNEFSNGQKVKATVGNASDPVQAAKDWSALFEGVDLSDSQTHLDDLTKWANQACDAYNCKSIAAQPDKLNQGDNGTADSASTSTTKNASTEVQCMMTKNANTGSTGDFPNGRGDYAWMCNDDRIKVCKDGDYGPVPAPYKYQCVWYAWTRLYMIHGINETYQGNGGEIGETATQHGWTNPDTPSPGDGLSYYGFFGSSGRPTGHVMVVEKVEDDPSGWKITLSEGNYACSSTGCWNGYNGGRTLTKAQLEAAGGVQNQNYWFFHNPKWDSNK